MNKCSYLLTSFPDIYLKSTELSSTRCPSIRPLLCMIKGLILAVEHVQQKKKKKKKYIKHHQVVKEETLT